MAAGGKGGEDDLGICSSKAKVTLGGNGGKDYSKDGGLPLALCGNACWET